MDADGRPREPYLGRLRGWSPSATAGDWSWTSRSRAATGRTGEPFRTSGPPAGRRDARRRAEGASQLVPRSANERDVRDARHVPAEELKALREQVRELDPGRLVTASFGGMTSTRRPAGGDADDRPRFRRPHRPRDAGSAGQTEARTRESLATMRAMARRYRCITRSRSAGVRPLAADGERLPHHLRGAVDGGAAGWCLHNGSSRGQPEERPRRSFDPHDRRLFVARLGGTEVVARAAAETHRGAGLGGVSSCRHFVSLDLPSDHGQGITASPPWRTWTRRRPRLRLRRPHPTSRATLWFDYRGPDDWVRHDVGTDYRSDVGLAALDVNGDGWVDLVCRGM